MKRLIATTICIALVASAAWAQPADQRDVVPGAGRGPGDWSARMLDRIARELELDEEQRAKLDEVTTAYREQVAQTGELMRELRQAMQENNEERMAELRAKMPDRRNQGAELAKVLEQLEPVLREDQLTMLWDIQDRMGRRENGRERYQAMVNELPDFLELTPGQRAEFDSLIEQQRGRMREQWTEMRPRLEELRKATEDGNQDRIAELRAQIEDARPSPERVYDGFFEDLKPILAEAQLAKLEQFRQERGYTASGEPRETVDVRNVLRAAKRVHLDVEQRDALREIERDAIGEYRKIDRKDEEAQTALATRIKDDVLEILQEDQAEQFKEQLSNMQSSSRRR